jgi:hypothetical protein
MGAKFTRQRNSNYREGWLPLVPIEDTGTVTFTLDSRTIAGVGTAFTSAMEGRKILGANGEYYLIASITNSTELIISEPYQGTTKADVDTFIWKDEYTVYPDVHDILDFINYEDAGLMKEFFPKDLTEKYPKEVSNQVPRIFTVLGRNVTTDVYSTGTVSGTVDTNIITGSGTGWLGNVEPGYQIKVGVNTYTIRRVKSDTSVELYQLLKSAITAGASYTAVGKNAIIIRFRAPSSQRVVKYSYYSKTYPLINDSDEDWMAELYDNLLIKYVSYLDHIDKNDPNRAVLILQDFDNELRDVHVADQSAGGYVRTWALDIPPEARE